MKDRKGCLLALGAGASSLLASLLASLVLSLFGDELGELWEVIPLPKLINADVCICVSFVSLLVLYALVVADDESM